ncbi:SAM-dependent methyltransferase [Silvimonas terrae]|uniref:SAM-dependent methyltransferase n=1 Tax=Silvimonas terrae TaxID=300266 RepID=A0A840RG94_9NEIS|nr:class I SAM-dependent methyltransferase [Silvimonas terrae]MBB5192355.1 SAM-dependent methyltransferase [Silvimonas terrae]
MSSVEQITGALNAPARSKLVPRTCPVCGAGKQESKLFTPRNIDPARLNALSFASRKVPEFMSHELVRCLRCDVVYACESGDAAETGEAYHEAQFDSSEEARDAAASYALTLESALATVTDKDGVLDIGTGTGTFLQQMAQRGFTGLVGIEPSPAAISAADEDIRPSIRMGLFDPASFASEQFALISCFMTLEHVHDPAALVNACYGLLKPGGVMVVVVHDWRAWNNRILGRRSPIVDIEHLQLFSSRSVTTLFNKAGFVQVDCQSFRNRYRLEYWCKLLPLPGGLRTAVDKLIKRTGLADHKIAMNVGNLMVVARKP